MRSIQLAIAFGIVMNYAAAQPSVVSGGVINGASFTKNQAVSPGSLVSIFGTGLSSSLLVGSTIPLSTTLSDVTVTFNGKSAGLYFVSSGQINAQLPWDVLAPGATTGSVNVVVSADGASSLPVPVAIGPFSPGIFTFAVGATQYAIATIFPDNALAAPVGAAPGSRPAKPGDTLTLYTTGLGAVDNPIGNGQIPPAGKLYNTTTIPTVLIGGANAHVSFSGLSPQFVGINQLNVVVPSVPAGAAIPIQIQMGGLTSTSATVIAVGN